MLHAILSSKAGRNLSASIDWRHDFSESEDSLTSFTFSLLSYLPAELTWRLLVANPKSICLPGNPGMLESISFWPRWDPSETSNASHVEPDVFLRFEFTDLVIEAKRRDNLGQIKLQWANELQSYINEIGSSTKAVAIIAIGGNPNETNEIIRAKESSFECPVVKIHWRTLTDRASAMLDMLSRSRDKIGFNSSVYRILEDLISVLSLHGFTTITWLDSLQFNPYSVSGLSIQNLIDLPFHDTAHK